MATAAEAEQAKRARKRARKQARRAEGGANFSAKKAKLVDDQAAANTAYLVDNDITIHEAGAPPPCLTLSSAPFPDGLVRVLCAQKGFTAPSPVQAATWPLAVSGRDVLYGNMDTRVEP